MAGYSWNRPGRSRDTCGGDLTSDEGRTRGPRRRRAGIREAQGLTREQFAGRDGLQVRAIQEWEQGRRKPEPAVRAYMLVIKNQPAAVRKALTAA